MLKLVTTTTNISPDRFSPPTPVPSGATGWVGLNGITNGIPGTSSTLIFKNAYVSEAQTVDTITHEWYHQNHDFGGETADQAKANEQAAAAAGRAAMAAYLADNGARCGGK